MYTLDLNSRLDDLTGSQKRIADFITKNLDRMLYLTEREISEELAVSPATISRFWRAIGFESNKQFKQYLKERMTTSPANKLEDILQKTDENDLLSGIFHLAAGHLEDTLLRLSPEHFERAVEALSAARAIYLYGSGPCEILVSLLKFRLNRLGLNPKIIAKSGHEIFESLVNIGPEDVIVIFGFVNMLREIRVLLDFKRNVGCPVILVTDLLVSDMIEQSDIVLYTARGALWEFHSMVAPLALVESLAVGVSRKNEKRSLEKLNELHRLRKQYESVIPRY